MVRLDPQRRARLIEEFEESDVTAVAFARRHRINYTTLCGWLQRHRCADQPTFVDETIYLNLTQPPGAPQVSVVNLVGDALVGDDVLLSVSAAGIHPNSSYQWYQGLTPLAGATNSSLQLDEVTRSNHGLYSVMVSNLGGFVQQTVGQVSVRAAQVLEMPTLLPNGNVRLRFRDADETLATDLSRFEIHSTDNPTGPGTVWTTNTSGIRPIAKSRCV